MRRLNQLPNAVAVFAACLLGAPGQMSSQRPAGNEVEDSPLAVARSEVRAAEERLADLVEQRQRLQSASMPEEVVEFEWARLRAASMAHWRSLNSPNLKSQNARSQNLWSQNLNLLHRDGVAKRLAELRRASSRLRRGFLDSEGPPLQQVAAKRPATTPTAARLSGRLSQARGRSLEGALVRLEDARGRWVDTRLTEADGEFSFSPGLIPGRYRLSTHNQQGFLDRVEWVTIPADRSLQTIAWTLASGATFSGELIDSLSGLPVDGTVFVCPESGTASVSCTIEQPTLNGSFTTPAVPAGDYYVVAVADTHDAEMWPDLALPHQSSYTTVTLPLDAAPTTVGDGDQISGLHFQLSPWSTISGSVTDADTGSPLMGAEVSLFGTSSDTVTTDGSGHFTSAPLPAGPYGASAIADEYFEECWIERDGCSSNERFLLASGADQGGIDFTLQKGARLSATVSVDGVPATTGRVNLYTTGEELPRTLHLPIDDVLVPPGAYYVVVDTTAPTSVRELWPGKACVGACDITRGGQIQPGPGEQVDYHFDVSTPAALTVAVSFLHPTLGTRFSATMIQIFDALGGLAADRPVYYFGSPGGVIPLRMPPGTYFVRTASFSGTLLNELYDDLPCEPNCDPTQGSPVTLQSGATEHLDFLLDARNPSTIGQLRIRVLPSNPAAGYDVAVFDLDQRLVRARSGIVPPGDAVFSLPHGRYLVTAPQFDGVMHPDTPCRGACNLDAATPVRVLAGRETTVELTLRLLPISRSGFEDGWADWSFATPVPD